jgi:hypothetical protein
MNSRSEVKRGIASRGPGRNRFSACVQAGLLFLMAGVTSGQTLDPIPVSYCNISYNHPYSYTGLEANVTVANPENKVLAQFVLEAFAQANSNGALLDPVSQTTVVTALTRLQSMWVPSSINFKSYYNDAAVSDTNSVEFITESLVQISYRFPHLLAQYGPVSQAGTIENLLSIILSEGQAGAINQVLTISYTNMWLFRLCNIILTGQGSTDGNGNVLVAPNAYALDRGRTDFMAWISTVRNNGIHEFQSPTYTGVDLEGAGYIELYARDPGLAAMAQQAYKLVWIDLYANWYNQDQRMGGTHSRTYEFLTDEDRETDRFFYAVSNLTTPPIPGWPILLTTRTLNYWRGQDYIAYILPPPSDVPNLFGANIAVNQSRTILRSFLSQESEYDPAYMYGENYMANPSGTGGLNYPFSIGSTESFYDDQTFEGLTIMMPGGVTTPNVNFNTQGRKDYYLQILAADGKADTLRPFIVSAQNAGETLFLASSNALDDTTAVEVASTIVIPNTMQVWIGTASTPVSLTVGQSIPLTAASTIFIQASNPGQTDGLVTGIRFLLSTDMNGNPLGLTLTNDGSLYNALRVTCIHSAIRPTTGVEAFAFWTRTGYCSDTSANFNIFRNALTSAAVVNNYNSASGTVQLSVPGLNSTMTIDANTTTETTASISGGDLDSAFSIPLLTVNGAEYVNATLQDWTSQDIGDATSGSAIEGNSDGFYTGQVRVTGSGSDIWGAADGFQFYYQTLVGNGTVTGQLANMPTGSTVNAWAKGGLMMRNDLTPGSMNALIGLDGTKGQRFSVRTTENGASSRAGNSLTAAPYWFKMTRLNNTFTGYSSPDGVTWTQVGFPTLIPMNNTICVGLAVTSCIPTSVITPEFASVGILQQ